MNDLEYIKQLTRTVLLCVDDAGNFRPIKGTTKTQCYNVLGEIQIILKTNTIQI